MGSFLKFSHTVSTAFACSADYPTWKKGWSVWLVFLCIRVASIYPVLHPLTCKMLGNQAISQNPLTQAVGASTGALHLHQQGVSSLMLLGLR